MVFEKVVSVVHVLTPEARALRRQRAISHRLEETYDDSNESANAAEAGRIITSSFFGERSSRDDTNQEADNLEQSPRASSIARTALAGIRKVWNAQGRPITGSPELQREYERQIGLLGINEEPLL
jgi:hypothetical protein